MTYSRPTDGPSGTFDPPLNTVRPVLGPSNAFLESYCLLSPKKDSPPPKADGVEGAFDASLSTLNKSGRPEPFNDNGQSGKLYMDKGLVAGVEFTEGANKGQKYLAKRDAGGNLTQLQVSFPEPGGKPGEPITLNKTDKGWVTTPPGKTLPQFRHLNVVDGAIQGDFKLDNNGDLTYKTQVGGKLFEDVLRSNGNKDFYNVTDYVGESVSAKGDKQTVYWTGYGEWAAGTATPVPGRDGAIKVVFPPKDGRPVSMIRDAKSNSFEVDFGEGKAKYKVDNWADARMKRTLDGKTTTLSTTGTTDASGALIWGQGDEKVTGDVRTVTFNKPEDAEKVKSGALPQETKIDLKTGITTATYANGTEITSDSRGAATRIKFKNKPHIDVVRDVNNQFRGFQRADGTTITKGANVNLGPGKLGASWTIQKPGQPPVTINGAFRATESGGFEIDGGARDRIAIDGDGNLTTKVAGKEVSEVPPKPVAPPPRDAKTEAKAAPPADVKDPPKDVPPPPTKPEVKPDQPKPAPDKPPAKAPLTDAQALELAKKHNVPVKIIADVRARMEKSGKPEMVEKCTKENLDKFFELAEKHKLLGDFKVGGAAMNMPPGAFIGKLIPELLTDPDNALTKAQEQMKDIQRRGIGKARPELLDGILNSIDLKFDQVRTATQPFVDEVKKEIASKKPEPPKPTPVPPPPKPPG